jgi:tRNA(fMet)-specific endonuclease VapC
MVYVLDTNIVLLSLGNAKFNAHFVQVYQPHQNDMVLSAVSEGELLSLALQRNWGSNKRRQLVRALQQLVIYPIKVQTVMEAYAEIDAYSQGKLTSKPMPAGISARNMGKNDLWIAATAAVTDATLLTADHDFSHLDGVFCPIDLVDVAAFR